MKFILPTLIIIAFTSCSSKKNDIELSKLNGPVLTITECTYAATEKFGEVKAGKLQRSYVTDFNEDGNVVMTTQTDMADTTITDKISTDDILSNGDTAAKDTFITAKHIYTTYYILNKKGQRIATKNSKSGPDRTLLRYDDSGNCIEDNVYNDDKKLDSKTKNTYVNDLLKEARVYNEAGNLTDILTYKYGQDEKLLEMYDVNQEDHSQEKYVYAYNNEGLITNVKVYKDNTLNENYVFKYSNFDSKGNWQRKARYINGDIKEVVERKIQFR